MPYGFNDDKSRIEVSNPEINVGEYVPYPYPVTGKIYHTVTNVECLTYGMLGLFSGTMKITNDSGGINGTKIGRISGVNIEEMAYGTSRAKYSLEQARFVYITINLRPNGEVWAYVTNGITSDETLDQFNFSVPFKAM